MMQLNKIKRWYIDRIWNNDDIRLNIQKGRYNIDLIIEKKHDISRKGTEYYWNTNVSIIKQKSNCFYEKETVLFSDSIENEQAEINITCQDYAWEQQVYITDIGKNEDLSKYVSQIEGIDLGGKRIELIAQVHSNLFLTEEGIILLQNRYLYVCTIKNLLSVEQGHAFFSANLSDICKFIVNQITKSKVTQKYLGVLSNKIDVILEPDVAGVVVHEICHLFEKDNFASMVGKKITNEAVTIKDNATVVGSWANRLYDDMGNRLNDCYVIQKGILCNVGSGMEKRKLFCEKPRNRFMINTVLINDADDLEPQDICSKNKKTIVLIDVDGAINDGKNIILKRCIFREINDGVVSAPYLISRIYFRIVDVLQKMIPIGKDNKLINGVCSNQYEVSYSAPRIRMENIFIGK